MMMIIFIPQGRSDRQGQPLLVVVSSGLTLLRGSVRIPTARSRLVATEVRRRGEDSILAPPPPLEVLHTIFTTAVTPTL